MKDASSRKMDSKEAVLERKPMEESTKLTKDDFELLKTVGKGSFGKVYEVGISHRYESVGAI